MINDHFVNDEATVPVMLLFLASYFGAYSNLFKITQKPDLFYFPFTLDFTDWPKVCSLFMFIFILIFIRLLRLIYIFVSLLFQWPHFWKFPVFWHALTESHVTFYSKHLLFIFRVTLSKKYLWNARISHLSPTSYALWSYFVRNILYMFIVDVFNIW